MTSLLTLKAKLIIGAVVFTLLTTTAVVTVNRIKSDAFKAGVAACEQSHTDALNEANAANRKREAELQSTIDDYARRIAAQSNQRRQREQIVVTKIEERLVETPNCQIDPAIIEMRNQLRQQS